MIEILPFEPHHLAGLELQTAQGPELGAMTEHAGAAADRGPAFTVRDAGRAILCAGLAENGPGYATAWALFAEGKGAGMVALTRAIQRVLLAADYRRVDMLVHADFARAHDFATMLGFKREGVMESYGSDGSDFTIYARVKPPGGI